MSSRHARLWMPLFYAVALIFSPLAHAQTRTAAPFITVYKTPT